MKVRIGIADSTKVVELEVDDPKGFEAEVASLLGGDGALVWVEDSKKRRVGIPADRIAYVEIETSADRANVGFGPSS